MTSSRIGRGAIVTLGAAASMAWAAGAANACDATQPNNPTPPTTTDHTQTTPTPKTVCTVENSDVEYAALGANGAVTGGWHKATPFQRTSAEPVYGYEVRLNPDLGENCTGSVEVSLASYDTAGATWETSGGVQTFVDATHVKLSTESKTSTSQKLTVKLPGKPGAATCFGQIDLYFGTKVYDGGTGADHGPLPNHDGGVSSPSQSGLITAWNGSDAGGCAVAVTTPPPSTTTTAPPTTPPTTSPTTPAAAPKTTASTPPTTSPDTPTLAHTGANVGEVSLVALAFFGAGGTAMFASRKAKAAAGKH